MVGCDLIFVVLITPGTLEMLAMQGVLYDAVESPRPLRCCYCENEFSFFEIDNRGRKLCFWTAGFV